MTTSTRRDVDDASLLAEANVDVLQAIARVHAASTENRPWVVNELAAAVACAESATDRDAFASALATAS